MPLLERNSRLVHEALRELKALKALKALGALNCDDVQRP